MMENSTFMYHFNMGLREEERLFKLSTAVLNKDDKLVITFIISAENYDKYLNDELKDKVKGIVSDLIPSSFDTIIVYKKTISESDYITRLTMEYIYSEAPLVFPKMESRTITTELRYDTIKVKIGLPPFMFSFMEKSGLAERLASYLDSQLMESVKVELFTDGKQETEGESFVRKSVSAISDLAIKTVSIEITEKIAGAVSKLPRYIADIIDSDNSTQTVCGKVLSLNKHIAKKSGKEFFTFQLNDTTGVIDVKYFPRFENSSAIFEEKVKDGVALVVEGPLRMDNYLGRNALTLYRAALCVIDYSTIVNEVTTKGEPENYETVHPQAYIEDVQGSIFDGERELPFILKGTIVIFDLETTGIYATSDKIVEIGAVKMVDGVLTETFSTLLNPKIPIPEEASKVNNIFDRDVENMPFFEDVVGDFYKFTRNAILAAHNAPFDIGFITYSGRGCGYNFDNEVIDTLKMARELLPNKKHSLENLCKEFDIPLVNAHRALDDAIGTAKLLRELAYLSQSV